MPIDAAEPLTPGDSVPGLIVRETSPRNLETPVGALGAGLTPTHRFYVRNHFDVPRLDAQSWRLRVEGAVRKPFDLTLAELRALPATTMVALLECAGNGRIALVPKAKGLLWDAGAVGNAEWVGVPLGALLDRAGVQPGAVEVILAGADSGAVADEPKTPGVIPYARSLPIAKARDVLIATRMNGADLTPDHGYPARAVVPGWYGMASVKWLARVIITERPFAGYFQTLEYSVFEPVGGVPSLVAVGENAVKAQITRPGLGEVVPTGRVYAVRGLAWAGEADVVRVEVSTDDGQTWGDARLVGVSARHTWRPWEWTWAVPERPGPHRLMARATDDRGRTQPLEREQRLRTYMIHHVVPVEVEAVAGAGGSGEWFRDSRPARGSGRAR